MRIAIFMLLAAFAAAPATAEERTQSRAEVLALPPSEAAEALLRLVAPRFVEMRGDPGEGVNSLTFLAFATAPENLVPGLCQATVLHIILERQEEPSAPPAIWSLAIEKVYKAVGEVRPHEGLSESRAAEQGRLCIDSGPVLPPRPRDSRARRYFGYVSGVDPTLAVVALQGAIRAARRGELGPIECAPRALGDCRDPVAEIAALDVRDLVSLEWVPQGRELHVDHILRASFAVDGDRPWGTSRRLSIDVNGVPLPGQPAAFNYRRTILDRGL